MTHLCDKCNPIIEEVCAVTAPDPQFSVPPPRPPAGPTYPPLSTPPDPMSGPPGPFSGPPAPYSGPPAPYSGPPAPYSVSPAAPAPAKRSRGAVLALGVAALALAVAVISLVVAWRAVDQAGDAKQLALVGESGQEAPATQAPAAAPETITQAPPATDAPIEPAPSGTAAPPLNEQTVYKPKYEKQSLTLKARCSYHMYADLDEPRANVSESGYDVALTGECATEPGFLRLGQGVEGSTSGAAGMTPHDCAERIRTSPLGDASIPARQGTVVCLTTSFAEAQALGENQRLVLFEITGVADDGAVTIKSTAWDIPR
jgi:hypothetical protein